MSESAKQDTPAPAEKLCAEAHAMCETTRAIVRDRPLAALAVAAALGFALGTLACGANNRR